MTQSVTISPLNRIVGHLAIHTDVEPDANGVLRVVSAKCEGEMYRGFENILQGRDPLDAQQITQRICGVCPIAHGIASVQAQEMAYGVKPVRNGRLLQNLIYAANNIQSHILHFYHLSALDFINIKAVLNYSGTNSVLNLLKNWLASALERNDVFAGAPFLPRYEVDQYIQSDEENWGYLCNYVQALQMRTVAHEMAAVFGAKVPHSTALVPTGVTQVPKIERVLAYRTRLDKLSTFIENVYIPDLMKASKLFPDYWEIGRGVGNFLSFGSFRMEENYGLGIKKYLPSGALIDGELQKLDPSKIYEDVANSRFSSRSGLHPYQGQTHPNPRNGYSWIKAPRYQGHVMEVGPLARAMVAYYTPGHFVREDVDKMLASLSVTPEKLNSVLGRHLIRGMESLWLVKQAYRWLDEIDIGSPSAVDFSIPENARGFGLTEAPRGSLGHWIVIEGYKIKHYQCVVPTSWNCSPRDDNGRPGAMEKALEKTPIENPEQPVEAGRVVRSFDPCVACSVH